MSDPTPTVEQADEYALVIADEVKAVQARAGEHWNLAEWAVKVLQELDAAEILIRAKAKDHLAYLLSEAKGRRAGLLWKYGQQIQAQVDGELVGKHRRSITYATGKVGYRIAAARHRLVLDDEYKAILWAQEFMTEAIKRNIDMARFQEYHKTTGIVPPGCHVETTPERDNFYIGPVTVTKPQLPAPAAAPAAPRQSAREFLGGSAAETPFE